MNVRSKAIMRALGASDGKQMQKPGPHHDFSGLTPSATARFPGGRDNSEMTAMKEGSLSYLGRPGKLGSPKVHSGGKGRDVLAASMKGK